MIHCSAMSAPARYLIAVLLLCSSASAAVTKPRKPAPTSPGNTPPAAAEAEFPTAQRPWKDSFLATRRAAYQQSIQTLMALPAEQVRAHPAAADFPGLPSPTGQPVTRKGPLNTAVTAWHSTGLYAAPGQLIKVTVPPAAVALKLEIRIGCHTDKLWADKIESWSRVPEISRAFKITAPVTTAANAFGGLVYLVVPWNAAPAQFDVTVEGALPAPYYVLGQTTRDDWLAQLRSACSPWGELQCNGLIFSVPSEALRLLDDPEPLMKFWEQVATAEDDLACVNDRKRPERFVFDRQISLGYMHSGYPAMGPVSAVKKSINLADSKKGHWGIFHELGHNHQKGEWTFDGTVEVTCNLFSMYCNEKVCGIPRNGEHDMRSPKFQAKVQQYLSSGTFEDWKSDPFLALAMYEQLVEAFGWDAYKKLFTEYRDLPKTARPKTDDEKRDQWLVRFSRMVGRNLGPFFQTWKVPTSEAARNLIADLPRWMPGDPTTATAKIGRSTPPASSRARVVRPAPARTKVAPPAPEAPKVGERSPPSVETPAQVTLPTADDVQALLAGVERIPVVGAPGTVVPSAPQAFPLIVGDCGQGKLAPVVAATRLGKGRIVALAHNGYFNKPSGDTGQLLLNAVRWAAGMTSGQQPGPRVAVRNKRELLQFLQAQQIPVAAADGATWQTLLKQAQVFCIDTSFDNEPALLPALTEFVRAGGGLVTAGTGWGWASLNPGKTLDEDYLGNRLLVAAGLVVTGTIAGGNADKQFVVTQPPPPLSSASTALERLTAAGRTAPALSKTELGQASHILMLAARALPKQDTLLAPRLEQIVKEAAAVPMPDKPLRAKQVLERLAVTVADIQLTRQAPVEVRPHPAAKGFPFDVPADAPRVTKKRSIDTRLPAWHSLGLYAAPGEVLMVSVPEAAAGKRLAVRIGCHTDQLWHCDPWTRWPNITRRVALDKPETRIANPFGGLIYIDVPNDCPLGTIDITLANAVESPLFTLGQTSVSEWRDQQRNLPGPWAELACAGVIITVPSRAVRNVDDPEAVLKFWGRAVELQDDLAAWKPGDRKRPERVVADQQISAGYMHSGYPIMCGNDVYEANVTVARLLGTPENPGGWGQWHELGHNHQSGDWTPTGCGEVTVNLFSMHVINQLYGVPLEKTRPDKLLHDKRLEGLRKYLASDRTPENWDPFEGLVMYFQLIDGFGWNALKQVLAEYRDLNPAERPKNDVEKWDQWMVRYSMRVGKNLGPFFQKWKIPVSKQALEAIEVLPPWMHADFAALGGG